MRDARKRIVAFFGAICVFGLTFGGLAVYAHFTRSTAPAAAPAGSTPIVAVAAPAVPPTPVAATGACAGAMGAVRKLQHRFASGSLLNEAANQALTADLARLDQDCSPALAQAFRTRELTPWLTYLPPGAGA